MAQKKVAPKSAPKKAAAVKPAPKKKTLMEKVEKLLEPIAPPAAVITTKPAEVDDGGPNEKYPFGIQFTTSSGFSYERFATAKIRDKRLSVVGKSETVCAVKYTPPGGIPKAPAPVEAPTGIAAVGPKGPKLVKGASVEGGEPINKRITPGARVETWRIARSVRVNKPGFFLQGGFYERADGTGRFTVGEEEHFTNLHKAKEAQVAKLPPSDDPEEVPSSGKKAK